jgi:hypothetical protein
MLMAGMDIVIQVFKFKNFNINIFPCFPLCTWSHSFFIEFFFFHPNLKITMTVRDDIKSELTNVKQRY